MKKTREEIEALKQNWEKDPIWDIEDTEGFEDYRDKLIAFRKKMERKWKKQRQKREYERLNLFNDLITACKRLESGYNIKVEISIKNL